MEPSENLLDRIKAAYPADAVAKAVLGRDQPEPLSAYKVVAGLICESTELGLRLYVPETVRALVLQEAHDNRLGGHFSAPKTQDLLERTFSWPNLATEVREYCKRCEICQRDKSTNQAPAGLLTPLPTPPRPWVDVAMDFMVELPETASGHNALLVVVCRLSKMVHLIKTTTQVTAPEVAQLFFDNIVRLHGIPVTIVSDRDSKFTSHFWRTLWKHLGTRLLLSTAYHPQTDGQTERTNRTLQEYLRHYVNEKQEEWDQYLTAAEFTYNNTVHSSTKYTPFQLVYGVHPNTPLTLAAQLPELAVPAVKDFLQLLKDQWATARANLQAAQAAQQEQANKRRRQMPKYQVGSLVMISTKHLNLPGEELSRKFRQRWLGPVEVTGVGTNSVSVILPSELATRRVHNTFNTSKVKPYLGPSPPIVLPPVPQVPEEEVRYEVEAILGHTGKGKSRRYLTKWAHFPECDATQEPLENFEDGGMDLIRHYHLTKGLPPPGGAPKRKRRRRS